MAAKVGGTGTAELQLVGGTDAHVTAQNDACESCNKSDGERGFARVKAMGGKFVVKRLCATCANARGVRELYESREALENAIRLAPARAFAATVVALANSNKAGTSPLFAGYSLAAVESGDAHFSCGWDECTCGLKDRKVGETDGLMAVEFHIKRSDGMPVWRPFVACRELTELVVQEAALRDFVPMVRPLDESDRFLEYEPAMTISSRNAPERPSTAASSVGASSTSDNPEVVATLPASLPVHHGERRPCKYDHTVVGDPQDVLYGAGPQIKSWEMNSRVALLAGIAEVERRISTIWAIHYPDTAFPGWHALAEDRREELCEEFRACLLHGMFFANLHGAYLSIAKKLRRFSQDATTVAVEHPVTAVQYTCPRCNRPAARMFVGDKEVVGKDADHKDARCKACRKREKRERNLTNRRAKDAAEMVRQHAVGNRGDDTNRKWKKGGGKKGKDKK